MYELNIHADQMSAFETRDWIVLELTELSKQFLRVLDLNGP
jgi:hypothetical protein